MTITIRLSEDVCRVLMAIRYQNITVVGQGYGFVLIQVKTLIAGISKSIQGILLCLPCGNT